MSLIGFDRARNLIIGVGAAGVDYTATFKGETNDIVLTGHEDEQELEIGGSVKIDTIDAATAAASFITGIDGVLKSRTNAEVLSDIGAAAASSISGTESYLAKFGAGGGTVEDTIVKEYGDETLQVFGRQIIEQNLTVDVTIPAEHSLITGYTEVGAGVLVTVDANAEWVAV